MKTEKEKMMAGQLYNAMDSTLVSERNKCQRVISAYNNFQTDAAQHKEIIQNLFGTVGNQFHVEPPFYCDYGYNIFVGENFYSNVGCVLLGVNTINIGDNVLLGPNVQIYTAGHPVNPEERLGGLEFRLPIDIGNNVWIGGAAIICPGVKIGSNVTVGAGSVVTKDIPDNVVVGGNPAKILKNL
jgi:maltose O-acetyltransferase